MTQEFTKANTLVKFMYIFYFQDIQHLVHGISSGSNIKFQY